MRKYIGFALCVLGFTAIISQFVLIRELLVVFYGNELAVGVMLASWLFWVGAGSWLFGRFSQRIAKPVSFYAHCSLLACLLLVGEVFLLRLSHPLLGFRIGEIVGFPTIFLNTFSVLAPLSLLLGAQFALGVRIFASTATDIGHAYVLESLGSIIGGLVFSFFLVRWLEPFQIVFLVGVGDLLLVYFLLFEQRLRSSPARNAFFPLVALFWIALLYLSFYGGHVVEEMTVKMAWKGRNVVYAGNSVYGNLVITRLKDQHSFFENGLLMFTSPEALEREEAVHYALLSHPKPLKVLLIGGGIGGPLREILKHPVKQVDYVEIDPLVVKVGQKFVAAADLKAFRDARVKTQYLDGRLFVNTTDEKFDVIILDLPDPYNGLLNRFYTREFFSEVKRVLKKGGFFSLGLSSSEEYIGPETRSFNSSIYRTLLSVFPRIAVVPGERAFFIAGTGTETFPEAGTLIDRLNSRKIKTTYVQPFYLRYKLTPQRVGYFEDQLARGKNARPNFDFLPVSYYYDTVLWSAQFSPSFAAVFKFFNRPVLMYSDSVLYWLALPALAFLTVGYYLWRRKRPGKMPSSTILTAVATAGLTGMALEVLLIASFQSLYGFVYAHISLIVTAFMVGLATGSWSVSRSPYLLRRTFEVLASIMATLGVFAVNLPFFLGSLSRSQAGISPRLFFFFLTALVGLVVGAVFPLAAKIFYQKKEESGRIGGMIYGADLFGSALGAIIISAFVFPIAGLTFSCLVLGYLCLVSFIFLLVCSFQKER